MNKQGNQEQKYAYVLTVMSKMINRVLSDAHAAGLSILSAQNGYPLQLQENEKLVVEFGINRCAHEWITSNYLRWTEGEIQPEKPETYTVCNLCWMTKGTRSSDG